MDHRQRWSPTRIARRRNNNRQNLELQEEEITINKTELGRAALRQLQGFASMAQLLPQAVVDNLLPEEHKKALLEKLCPADVQGTGEVV